MKTQEAPRSAGPASARAQEKKECLALALERVVRHPARRVLAE